MNTTAHKLESIFRRIVEGVAFHHQDIEVSIEAVGTRTGVIAIRVHKGDMPRVLGQGGKQVMAMNSMANLMGEQMNLDLQVRVDEPIKGEPDRFSPFQPKKEYPRERLTKLMQDIVAMCLSTPATVDLRDASNFASIFLIHCTREEAINRCQNMQSSLSVIFNAIGKKEGRHMLVDIDHPMMSNPLKAG